MNKSIPYALQVGTLALWLSCFLGAVIGFGVKQEWILAIVPKPKTIALQTSIALEAPIQQVLEDEPATDDFTESSNEAAPLVATVPNTALSQPVLAELTPPPMPEMVEMPSLPDVPNLPAPVIRKTATKVAPANTQLNTKPATKPTSRPSANTPPATATSLSYGSGPGRQPAPAYPLTARRSNQQGTVVVEFIVGTDGRVLSAWVKSPCPFSTLNNAAVSTIRSRWKFPSGAARRYKIPIVFRLS
jgi:protein TonB